MCNEKNSVTYGSFDSDLLHGTIGEDLLKLLESLIMLFLFTKFI